MGRLASNAGHNPTTRQLHTAVTIPAGVLRPDVVVLNLKRIGRVLGSGLSGDLLGAAGKREDSEKGTELPGPVHLVPSRTTQGSTPLRARHDFDRARIIVLNVADACAPGPHVMSPAHDRR